MFCSGLIFISIQFWMFELFPNNVFSLNADFPRTSEDINGIFIKHKIVPDVIPLAPEYILRVEYSEGIDVDYGNLLDPIDMIGRPESVYWPVDREEYYTLILTDPDAPSAETPFQREWQHWIVVNIPETEWKKGEELTYYIGQVPYQVNSLHRFVFLLYKHPHRKRLPFSEQYIGKELKDDQRANFSAHAFAQKYKLGRPLAGNFCYGRWNTTIGAVSTERTLHPWDTWED